MTERKQNLQKKEKCNICKKKNVINIICTKCNKTFCIHHRCPENHSCEYEHKKDLKLGDKFISSKMEVI